MVEEEVSVDNKVLLGVIPLIRADSLLGADLSTLGLTKPLFSAALASALTIDSAYSYS